MRIFILLKFVFCLTEAFVNPCTRIKDIMENTIQETIDDIKHDKLASNIDIIKIGFGQNLISAEEFKLGHLII